MNRKYKVVSIKFQYETNDKEREVLVMLDNGSIIHICACYESWHQYNGTTNELWTTCEIADAVNDWLHSGDENDKDFALSDIKFIIGKTNKENEDD